MRTVAVCVLVLACACTKPNPKSCADGTCTDPAFPFCDVDGAVEGHPNTCLAVDCTPGTFETCRGGQAITCNANGTDFDVTECPLGCDVAADGCRQCADNAQCTATAPVCDPDNHQCRTCKADDECASKVCDLGTGECVPEANVVYASVTLGQGQCLLSNPCSLSTAMTVASASATTPTVRMLPGTYTTAVELHGPVGKPIPIVGTGATIALADTSAAVSVDGGGKLDIRGLKLVGQKGLHCGTATGAASQLAMHDTQLTITGNLSGVLEFVRCSATISGADVSLGGSEIAVTADSDTKLVLDRVRLHGSNIHHVVATGQRVTIDVTNSLFEDVGFDFNTTDSAAPGSQITLAEDTIVFAIGSLQPQGCTFSPSPNRRMRYENSIVATINGDDAIAGTSCSFVTTLLSSQATALAGTAVGDPLFIDPTAGDFRLQPTSRGVDAATPSILGLDSTLDLDGTARPQGVRADLGAYER